MKFENLPGRFAGIDGELAIEVARKSAFRDAIRLSALAYASYFPNDQIISEAERQIVDCLGSFAINARRTLELLDIQGVRIEGGRWKFKDAVKDLNEATDLRDTVNKIVHARMLQVFVFQKETNVFLDAGHEWVFTYAAIRSDRGPTVHVNPVGLAYSFLNALADHDQNVGKQ
jgi:hypothetical protein